MSGAVVRLVPATPRWRLIDRKDLGVGRVAAVPVRPITIAAVATKTVTTLVDDIDGSTDDVLTCAFGLGDASFEIDLNAAHREELESVLAKFVAAARSVDGGRPARKRRGESTGRTDSDHSHAIRQWAKENDYEVSERGRISKTIVAAYEAAH